MTDGPDGAEAGAFTGTRRYVVRREVGVGAAGRVYEAWDASRKTEVALKTLATLSPRALYRFKSEFRALADIRHDNLAALHELVVEGDTWFIVMELVRGTGWAQWVRGAEATPPTDSATFLSQDGLPESFEVADTSTEVSPPCPPPDFDRVRDALVQLLRGLDALHTHGKLHRDVKPSNVAVTPEGRVVLLDFGLVYDTDRAVSELSRVDRVVGTAAFMAPEQALGEAPTPAGDLYSVGVMLFHALTGRLPFEGGMVEMLSAKQVRDAPPPGALVHGLPPDLEALCIDLLARAPDARPTTREAMRRLGAEGVGPSRPATLLVGRETERQELEDAWARARNGRCTVVTVEGPVGIGKTVLVRHFLGGLKQHEDVWILRGRCHERETVPLKAIDTLMDSARRKLARLEPEERAALDPGETDALVQLFPVLAEVLEVGEEPDSLTGKELRRAAVDAGARLLRALARDRPLVIFLDDAQWGDTGSARFLMRWAHALSHTRVLMVLSGRTDGPFLSAIRQDRRWVRLEGRVVEIGALSDDAVRPLARNLLEDRGDVVDWVIREARGHPALAIELASAYLEEPFELGSVRFEDLLRGRLERLPPEARRVLFAVAVASRPTPLVVLESALPDVDVEAVAVSLVEQRLLRSRRLGRVPLVELVHPRIAPIISDTETPEAQARMHRTLAEALDGAGWGEPTVLVEHYLAAGDHVRVGPLALRAAESAVVSLDYDGAIELYRTALAFVDGPDRDVARRALAEALSLAGRGLEAAEAFSELALDAEGTTRTHLLRRAAEQALYTGHVERGVRLLDEVLVTLDLPTIEARPPGAVRRVADRVWRGLSSLGRRTERASPEAVQRIDAAFAVAIALQLLDPQRGAWFHGLALYEARRIDDAFRIGRSRCLGLAMHAASSQDWDAWRVEAGEVRRAVAKLHSPYANGLLAVCEGISAYLDGTFRAGLRVLSGAERHLAHVAAPFELTVARVWRVRCLVWTGELVQADKIREGYVAEGLDRGNELLVRSLRGDVMALIDLAADRPDDVKLHVVDIIESWSGGRWPFQRVFALRAEILRLLYLGRPEPAWEASERLLEIREHLAGNVVTQIHIHFARGRAAIACSAAGTDRLGEALDRAARLERVKHRLAAPFAHVLRGCAAWVTGDEAEGRVHLETAVALLDRVDLALHVAAIRYQLAHRTGDERQKAAAEGWLRHQGVVRPEALCRVFVPGLD